MFSLNRRSARARYAQRSLKRNRAWLYVEVLEDRCVLSVSFLGVGAGDATSSDAILWTRAQNSSTAAGVAVHAQVSTDATFATDVATFSGITDPAHDYTIHIDATGLFSGTRYFYRFVANDGTISQLGTFVTAPDPNASVPVRFGFTGDADGLMRPYPATASADFAPPSSPNFGTQPYDYFVWLGDTIYETASGQGTPDFSPAVSNTPTLSDYLAKYRQQLQPVSTGSYAGLQNYFDSTGHYTLLDNHETGNREFQSGGAPASAPFNTTDTAFDVNTTGAYMNQTAGFQVLEQAYTDYQPVRQQVVNSPGDPRSDGTQQLYFEQQWGANNIFFNLDDRSYRDIRLRTGPAGGSDDNGVRADNPDRTMLGQTQLQWFEQSLLAAKEQGILWKIVAISSPIDQIGPIGGSFTLTNGPDNGPGTYSNTESDGGKSWMGGYRAERNAMLKFIADNQIDHVIFLTTDDHQLRINELGYFTQFDNSGMPIQSSYTRVPGVMQILDGPIGATGPDLITDHSIANIQTLAENYAAQQILRGIDPIGLDPAFPGLTNVWREGDPTAATDPKPFDFYSPDTFNYAVLELSPDGSTFTVTIKGIDSYATNTFPQPGDVPAVREIMHFQIALEPVALAVSAATATAGQTATLNATLTDAHTLAPLANRTLTFSLNGQVIGTAATDDNGEATLTGVSVNGMLPGHYAGAVTVRFAGDAADLPGAASAALDILPARDVSGQVRVRQTIEPGPRPGTTRVDLDITNRFNSETLTGLFAIQLNDLTPGVTLESAMIFVNGQAQALTVTYDADGNPIVNIPASIATRLRRGQSLPLIALVFDNPDDVPVHFQTQVFLDPLES
jgi:3-phytase/alkaline phosphatase D